MKDPGPFRFSLLRFFEVVEVLAYPDVPGVHFARNAAGNSLPDVLREAENPLSLSWVQQIGWFGEIFHPQPLTSSVAVWNAGRRASKACTTEH